MSDDLRVNGNIYGWGSHICKIDGERWFGLTSFSYDQERARAFGYGMNRAHAPTSRTSGKYTPGAVKIRMHKHAAVALRKRLASLAEDGRSYGNPEFPMLLQLVEGSKTTTTEFERCVVTKDSDSVEENPDPTMEEWEVQPMKIIKDGLTLYDSSEDGV